MNRYRIQSEKTLYFGIFIAVLLFLQGILIVVSGSSILPSKYFYDAITIERFIVNLQESDDVKLEFFESYTNIANFYIFTGIALIKNTIFQKITIYLLAYICFVSIFLKLNKKLNYLTIVSLFVWNIPIPIYLGQLCKDIIPFIIMSFIVLFVYKKDVSKKRLFIIFLIMSIYALYHRQYWFILLVFTSINYILVFNVKNVKILKNLKIRSCITIFVYLMFFLMVNVFSTPLSDNRVGVNAFRDGSVDATTMFSNTFINTGGITDFLNWIIIVANLIFPFSVLSSLSILSFVFVIWNFFNIVLFVKIYKKTIINNRRLENTIKFFYSLGLGFLLTQATFEPDLGSFLRHELVLVPIMIAILSIYKNKMTF
ncbi:hypothetical protein ACTQ5K_17285 [Niallia sp. Sow4_A1]|uniref:hypothetical protein n=1 Tax=Niallia sp. Sow4_A1 TaxID=3438793 RepID=UPI003F9D66A3